MEVLGSYSSLMYEGKFGIICVNFNFGVIRICLDLW